MTRRETVRNELSQGEGVLRDTMHGRAIIDRMCTEQDRRHRAAAVREKLGR
jgi:hypothetical protein